MEAVRQIRFPRQASLAKRRHLAQHTETGFRKRDTEDLRRDERTVREFVERTVMRQVEAAERRQQHPAANRECRMHSHVDCRVLELDLLTGLLELELGGHTHEVTDSRRGEDVESLGLES